MREKDKFDGQRQKLENLCEENKLTYSLQLETYPVTLTLRPLQGMFEQLSMLESAEAGEDRISQDAFLTFYSKDGDYGTKTFGTFTISEALQNKFKNIFKKIDVFWKHYFFRECIETGAIHKGMMPIIEEGEEEQQPDEEAELEDAEDADDILHTETIGELIERATQLVRQENTCTTSLLQRRLKLGYHRATVLIEILEGKGVVGPYRGSAPREVLPYDLPEDGEAEE